MDTSRRRAPVIAWTIAAAALYGAVGIAISTPAFADDSGRRVGADASGGAGSGKADGARGRPRGQHAVPSRIAVSDRDDPCRWWPAPTPIPRPLPVGTGDRGSNSGILAVLAVAPTIPVPRFDAAAEPVIDIADIPDAVPAGLPAAEVPVAPPAPVVPVPPPVTGNPVVTAAPPGSDRVPIVRPRPASVPAAMGANVPAQRPVLGTEPPTALRLGYPDELRDADLARVLSLALPGLAAMAAMTAFGGVVGYRQAKAGYLLRAAGAGRFLQ